MYALYYRLKHTQELNNITNNHEVLFPGDLFITLRQYKKNIKPRLEMETRCLLLFIKNYLSLWVGLLKDIVSSGEMRLWRSSRCFFVCQVHI